MDAATVVVDCLDILAQPTLRNREDQLRRGAREVGRGVIARVSTNERSTWLINPQLEEPPSQGTFWRGTERQIANHSRSCIHTTVVISVIPADLLIHRSGTRTYT